MDQLPMDLIKQCSQGVVDVVEENGGIVFRRFPRKIREHYHAQSEGTAIRTDCTAGVVVEFQTDATQLKLTCGLPQGARPFAYVDVYSDRTFIGALGDSDACDHIAETIQLPNSTRDQQNVEIYLPHCRTTVLQSLSVNDGATIAPLIPAPQFCIWVTPSRRA